MESQRTKLLIALIVAAALAAIFSYSWQDRRRDAAKGSVQDLAVCRQDLADLASWGASSSPDAPPTVESADLNTRIRAAATEAGVPDQLASIDPGQSHQVRDTGYTETPVFLRLNTINVRQLVTFLHSLSAHDAGMKAKSVELTTPPGQTPETAGDLWTADVALAYLTYTQPARTNHP